MVKITTFNNRPVRHVRYMPDGTVILRLYERRSDGRARHLPRRIGPEQRRHGGSGVRKVVAKLRPQIGLGTLGGDDGSALYRPDAVGGVLGGHGAAAEFHPKLLAPLPLAGRLAFSSCGLKIPSRLPLDWAFKPASALPRLSDPSHRKPSRWATTAAQRVSTGARLIEMVVAMGNDRRRGQRRGGHLPLTSASQKSASPDTEL